MFGFNKRKQKWGSGGSSATAPTRRTVEASFHRDPIESGWGIKIVPRAQDGQDVELKENSVLHVCAQFLAEGRAQVAEYAANAHAAVREILAESRARRFEAVQQAKARRIMLESYQAALKRHAEAQRILGPHVRFSGGTGKNLWITLFLLGDAAGMTLALTYGGESPFVAAIMALAVGASVVVLGKMGEDLRRESVMKSLEFEEDEAQRVVEAVFGLDDRSRALNRKVMYGFITASATAGVAITIYRSVEESLLIGLAFGLWAILIGAGSFAASWYYHDPAKTYIALTQDAVDNAEDIWLNTDIDAIEDHNAAIEAARHIVGEHRQRAEAAWNMTIAGAAAAMAANSNIIGVAQDGGHWILGQQMPDMGWPELRDYFQIVDRDDLAPESGMLFSFSEDGTNQIPRPAEYMRLDDFGN